MLKVTLSYMQNKSVLSLALSTVYRPPEPYTDFVFTDLINSFGVKQNVTGTTHRFNHTVTQCQPEDTRREFQTQQQK